jgi:hypothetical protein
MKLCLVCDAKIIGRVDKKFCSTKCKSAYQYQQRKLEDDLFFKIDKQLKTNRRILKAYNKSGLSTVRKEKLISEGFDPRYFTHYWKSNKGDVYLFCYEYGFLELKTNAKEKYLLVVWQDYMEKSC